MTDYSTARFFAISSIGYGKGFTAEEAEENYYETQARNFRHMHRTRPGRIAWLKEHARPNLFHAPEGTVGFVLDSRVRWEMADGSYVESTEQEFIKSATEVAPQ